eukprot:SM000110S18918  [mRNA]  locus=s110:322120:324920:+ [translate_table: standard]
MAGGASGLTFKLHPLVLLNISDHFSRTRAQAGDAGGASSSSSSAAAGAPPRVLGCVLGAQSGRHVEIFNSFELKHERDAASGAVVLALDFLETKIEQYKKVFPKYDVLGWYSTGTSVEDADMQVHRALMDINESPIYVLLNPAITHGQKDLPISIYESELHVIEGVPSLIFVKSSYTIETVEAERISVDHVAHIKPSDGSSAATQLAAHLTGMHSAIKMLSSRIRVLHTFLSSVQKGDVPHQRSLLRQIASLVQKLPAIDSSQFQDDFLTEYNDTLLMTYLASMTKTTSVMNEMVDKFSLAYDKQGRRGSRTAFA